MNVVLNACTPAELATATPGLLLEHARKAVAMVHRGESLRPTSLLPRAAATAIAAVSGLRSLALLREQASPVDAFTKYAYATHDGHAIETVRIPLEAAGRYSVCVSSQVGCGLACAFCATGRQGLVRNLAPWEIIGQVAAVRDRLRATLPQPNVAAASRPRIHGVLFQGMGEPLSNLDAVVQAIAVFRDPCAFGIDGRAITVSTAGLPSGIAKLAERAPTARLAISIGSLRPEVRERLLPISRAHTLEDSLAAAAEHVRRTGLAPMWAMTLLAGHNDSPEDARLLAARAQTFWTFTGKRPRLSIIPYNAEGPDDPFRRSSEAVERAFFAVLRSAGLPYHKRYSGGQDVAAGCGQLAQIRLPTAL